MIKEDKMNGKDAKKEATTMPEKNGEESAMERRSEKERERGH